MIISGSKDSQQPIKLWDPRTGTGLTTLHAHKNTCMDVKWNKNGNLFLTASRDHLIKLFDVRNLREDVQTYKGHRKEVVCECIPFLSSILSRPDGGKQLTKHWTTPLFSSSINFAWWTAKKFRVMQYIALNDVESWTEAELKTWGHPSPSLSVQTLNDFSSWQSWVQLEKY